MSVILYTCDEHDVVSSSSGVCIECEEKLVPVEYVPSAELADLQNRFEAMSDNYGSAVLEIERLKALLVDLDKLNRMARKEGQGALSLDYIYQPRIDEALGLVPFAEPDPIPVTKEEMRGQGL